MDKVGYNRMQVLLERIEDGDVRVVEKETCPRARGRGRETISQASLAGVKGPTARLERQYMGREIWARGATSIGGMLNENLASAVLRVVQEWMIQASSRDPNGEEPTTRVDGIDLRGLRVPHVRADRHEIAILPSRGRRRAVRERSPGPAGQR
jgi:hypothetical protein